MKYLMNKKLWAAIIGLVTAFGTFMVTLDEAKANTSFAQGFNVASAYMSKVDNGTCHAIFGSGRIEKDGPNAWIKGGWSDLNFSNVEIWITGTIPTGCTAPAGIPGFTTPRLIRTGSYTAGTIEGASIAFFNYMVMNCTYQSIFFDTNINGVLDWQGMESCQWQPNLAGAKEHQSRYATYNSTLHTKLAGSDNLYGAYTKVSIDGKYQIGVGSEALTSSSRELYFFYQYWEGGVLKRKYLKQDNSSHYPLVDSTTATPIYSKTKIGAGKIVLAGTVAKVAGRAYYIKVDNTLNGSPDSGYDVEIPALP